MVEAGESNSGGLLILRRLLKTEDARPAKHAEKAVRMYMAGTRSSEKRTAAFGLSHFLLRLPPSIHSFVLLGCSRVESPHWAQSSMPKCRLDGPGIPV